ncbi:MAG: ABC transporter permease [Propionibacteriaceae bacterium]|nr:ABC transporter permease [Propionibacteriaceae bacterium]
MSLVWTLTQRNLRVFWRDHATVFLSLLSPLVLFCMFLVFYRHMITGLVTDSIPAATVAQAHALCDAWLFSSVAGLATFTSSLGMLMGFVDDRVTGRFADYLVSPVRRWHLAAGHLLATLCVSFLISVVLLAAGQVWALIAGQPTVAPLQDLYCLGAVLITCLTFSAFNTLLVTFTATQGSFGGYAVTMGTAVGFLSFCYVPPTSLSSSVISSLSTLPFAQGAAMIRRPIMTPAIDQVVNLVPEGPAREQVRDSLQNGLAMQLSVNGHTLSAGLMVGVLLALAVLLTTLASWRMGRIIR